MISRRLKPDDLIVKSLTAFIKDVGNQFQVSMRYQKLDTQTIEVRLRAEGLGFATKTLPKFGKHFDSALQTGKFRPIGSFRRRSRSALPSFMQGLTRKVFALDGTLLDTPCVDAIRAVRQLAYMFYKLEGEYPKELVNEVIEEFVQTDRSLGEINPFDHSHYCFAYSASQVVRRLFTGFRVRDIKPRPGPGVTADRVHHSMRYEPHVKYAGLHAVYPYSYYFYANSGSLIRQLQVYKELPVKQYGESKLAVVPKDSRGPRIICTEPHEFMWFQQGLGRAMMAQLERHPLSRGHVNFYDQTINGNLALSSSRDGKFVTLDMKEASDRISMALVEACFDECPDLLKALLACSTRDIRLPSGEVIRKNKFAPMGSALCFPVMSTVHFALAVAAVTEATGQSANTVAKNIYVYGDDLIVHHSYADYLLAVFPLFGLKFNEGKCCMEGRFRESCGVDAYNGIDVTPQRVKTHAILKKDPASLKRFLASFHGFFNRGLWNLAKVFQDEINGVYGDLPCCTRDSDVVGWIVPRSKVEEANRSRLRWNKSYQSLCLKARVVRTRPYMQMFGNDARLLRAFSHATQESGTLMRRGQIKMIWTRIPLSSL